MSENKYSLISSTFTGTLNQLHFILFIHLSSHLIFQFLHVVLWSTLACLLGGITIHVTLHLYRSKSVKLFSFYISPKFLLGVGVDLLVLILSNVDCLN